MIGWRINDLPDGRYCPRKAKCGNAKPGTLSDYGRHCACRRGCNGECRKNCFLKTPDGQPGLKNLSSDVKRFLAHANPYLRQLSNCFRQFIVIRPKGWSLSKETRRRDLLKN